jgi:hypothetical protein
MQLPDKARCSAAVRQGHRMLLQGTLHTCRHCCGVGPAKKAIIKNLYGECCPLLCAGHQGLTFIGRTFLPPKSIRRQKSSWLATCAAEKTKAFENYYQNHFNAEAVLAKVQHGIYKGQVD